jgi:malate synthase
MNMQSNTLTLTDELGFDAVISKELNMIDEHLRQHQVSLTNYAKAFLDKTFPLCNGSHKDAVSYVIYYNHLLAFMEDGTHSGLLQPKQFIGLCGHKEEPDAILLKENERFVEITFNRSGCIGKTDKANIDDIQVETSQKSALGDKRVWFSMIKDNREVRLDKNGNATYCCRDEVKSFTSKSGHVLEV